MSEPEILAPDGEPFDLEREPLDSPETWASDWGGDGSDLTRPVRTHVLAALRPPSAPYPPPVDGLRQFGEIRADDAAKRRRALGIGQEHVADLARMARDRSLFTANSDTPEVWAPLHALEALAELDPTPVVGELIPLLDVQDDFTPRKLDDIFKKAGAAAVGPLQAYLEDRTRWGWGHAIAAGALEKVALAHPELREQVVAILSAVLRDAEEYTRPGVTGAMDSLVELGAVESLPLIRHAFEIGKIDEQMRGPWGVVLKEIGVAPEPDDPLVAESQRRYEEERKRMFPAEVYENLEAYSVQHRAQQEQVSARAATQQRKKEHARKEKNKRKAASAARKANRKRRK